MFEVYPRAYGGTLKPVGPLFYQEGLSPRVRGNLFGLDRCNDTARSIPARTGEPIADFMDELQNRVYPRAYGGTLARDLVYSAAVGLSPRVRGNRTP